MHRCLRIPDILQITFEELVAHELGFSPSHGKVALSRLAQTCRQFSELALDILWESQYTLTPLLKTFPAHVWEISNTNSSTQTFRFRSNINLADWNRVLKYASRIRKLNVPPGLRVDVVELLSVPLPVQHFLPNLLNLIWHPWDAKVFTHIGLFLGPKLSVLDLHADASIVHSSLLTSLPSKYPSLTDLTLRWSGVGTSTLDAASALVSSLPQLQRLSVPCLNASAYKSLAALPTLRHFAIDDLEAFPADSGSWSHPRFSGLTSLEVSSSLFTRASPTILATLSNTPLRVFQYESQTNPTMADMRNCS
ncbi:hypothetical protein C8R46DRAFT_1140640 [Mycena filopes]|nr:hypothetical protein C8R46DRAFT_1140640 [Mycena filopes]